MMRTGKKGRDLISHEAAEVEEVVDELEHLRNVVGDGGAVGMELSQVFFIDLADSCKSWRNSRGTLYIIGRVGGLLYI